MFIELESLEKFGRGGEEGGVKGRERQRSIVYSDQRRSWNLPMSWNSWDVCGIEEMSISLLCFVFRGIRGGKCISVGGKIFVRGGNVVRSSRSV